MESIAPIENPLIVMNKVNEEVLNFAKKNLAALLGSAPSDSFIKMSIDAATGKSTVTIDLRSLPLRTTICKVAKSPYMAIEKAIQELRISLSKWKVIRFESPDAGEHVL